MPAIEADYATLAIDYAITPLFRHYIAAFIDAEPFLRHYCPMLPFIDIAYAAHAT